MARRSKRQEAQVAEGKVFAILAYLSILCIIPLLFKKENSFVLTHGKQGLVLFLGEVGIFIAHILLGTWILRLGMFVLSVMSFAGMIAVLRGRAIELPLVSEIAAKITL